MDTSRDRFGSEADDDKSAPNETMSGVGVPGDDATIEGLGFDGPDDEAPLADGEHPTEAPATDPARSSRSPAAKAPRGASPPR